MELILKEGLPHQQEPVQAVAQVFSNVSIKQPNFYYMNPSIDMKDEILKENIKYIQSNMKHSINQISEIGEYLNLDIKMETGTGKTYVYTKTMFELNKHYGINKFIIAVPTLPIKAGIEQFLEDNYTRQHFRDVCRYDKEIELQVLEAKKKKQKKSYFPSAIRDFVKGSNQDKKKIYVLLVNMHFLTERKNSMLIRDDYDYGVEGFYRPVDALKATKPLIIIDEPHRFSKEQKSFEFILKYLKPQCILRYGATFPYVQISKGKNKVNIRDYHNLLYDLNACDAFNMNLIKGIAKEHLEPISKKEDKVKIVTINSKTSINIHYYCKGQERKVFTLEKGDPLSIITQSFEGLHIKNIGKDFIELSNGEIKYQGEEFSTDIYSTSYQEQMIRLALERHFETERSNFNRKFKIKTLALFFIDDIYSYRKDNNSSKEPYLLKIFEKLLREKIDIELNKINDNENEYREYLLATKENISEAHAGYFSQDNSDSDEEIAKEISEILYEKKSLISIKDDKGKYNVRRFLFSKWTLKEGWDNPNVFTIAKLRSSGSENSKLQEVGRGLRLPVDENGNRISNEEFRLNYIVDFTEADFAERLVEQVNGELPQSDKLSREVLQKVANNLGITENELFKSLLIKDYVDLDYNIILNNKEEFFAEYPQFITGIQRNKITDINKNGKKMIKIRESVYEQLSMLWKNINQKYLLCYDDIPKEEFENELLNIFKKDVFVNVTISSCRDVLSVKDNKINLEAGVGVEYTVNKTLPYNEFLKRINESTNIPIVQIHNVLVKYSETNIINKELINQHSVTNFVKKFNEWKINSLIGRFHYQKANISVCATALTNADGTLKTEIMQGRIGTRLIEGQPSSRYLYDTIAYDSELEKKNIMTEVDEIIVYGKIPRNSICIPTITGQSYSPDFMYVVKKNNGEKILNAVVETKDVENTMQLREVEKTKIECAKIFFEQLKKDGYNVSFYEQLNNKEIAELIDSIIIE